MQATRTTKRRTKNGIIKAKGYEIQDGYELLATAVIEQACADYMDYMRKYEYGDKKKKGASYERSKTNYDSAVRFFDDDNPLYQLYSQEMSASYLLRKMNEKLQEERKEKQCQQVMKKSNKPIKASRRQISRASLMQR